LCKEYFKNFYRLIKGIKNSLLTAKTVLIIYVSIMLEKIKMQIKKLKKDNQENIRRVVTK
jgi:hypothetical protein